MKPELIVALDVPSSREVPAIVDSLPAEIKYYKVGLELFTSEGPKTLEYLQKKNKHIFLDLKLHDIPRTVANAVKSAARQKIKMLTVHACGGRNMLKAAAEAAAECAPDSPLLIAVTTLTSLDQNDLKDLGIKRDLKEQAKILGEIALSSGINGLVTSALEVNTLRDTFGDQVLLITPGIRPADGDIGDQKRIATPEMAVKGGATHLVVGRPILQAPDPNAAALQILKEMNTAYSNG